MDSIAIQLGGRLRALRQERGMSQEQLALKSGVNTTFLGHVERGVKKPTIETIGKLANALDISLQELFSFDQPVSNSERSDVINKILFELNGCSPDEQECIYKIIKQIIYFSKH